MNTHCPFAGLHESDVQTTAIVFGFVVIMALFLFSIDTTLAWIVKLLTGRTE